jgi:hypothetical protein
MELALGRGRSTVGVPVASSLLGFLANGQADLVDHHLRTQGTSRPRAWQRSIAAG